MNKFNTLIAEAKAKKPRTVRFKGKHLEPGELRDMFKKAFLSNLSGVPDEMHDWVRNNNKYMSDKDTWDNFGFKMDGSYSVDYKRDINWAGYLDVEVDTNRYDSKEITQLFKKFRSDIKFRTKWYRL